MGKNGGVVMVNFIPMFISKENMDWSEGLEQTLLTNPDLNAVRKIEAEYRKTHGPEPPGDAGAGVRPHRTRGEGGWPRPCRHRQRLLGRLDAQAGSRT